MCWGDWCSGHVCSQDSETQLHMLHVGSFRWYFAAYTASELHRLKFFMKTFKISIQITIMLLYWPHMGKFTSALDPSPQGRAVGSHLACACSRTHLVPGGGLNGDRHSTPCTTRSPRLCANTFPVLGLLKPHGLCSCVIENLISLLLMCFLLYLKYFHPSS